MNAPKTEPLLSSETERRLESIAEALPRTIIRDFDPKRLLWLADALGRCERLFGTLLLDMLAEHSKDPNVVVDREVFRRTLRSILGPLKEYAQLPSFGRLMFHATGNQDFGTVPAETVCLGNTDEQDCGTAIEMIAELDAERLTDPERREEAVELLAKLHAIARHFQEEQVGVH